MTDAETAETSGASPQLFDVSLTESSASDTLEPAETNKKSIELVNMASGAVIPARTSVRTALKRPLPMKKKHFRWLLVVASFFSQFFTSGANWAYGVYSASYCETNQLGTNGQQRLCALPGSLAVASWSLTGLIVGRIADDPRVGFRITALIGAFLFGAAYLIASFSTNYILTVVSQGLMAGMGASFAYFPSLSILPSYFAKRHDFRGAALGIAISGMSNAFVSAACVDAHAFFTRYRIWRIRVGSSNRSDDCRMGNRMGAKDDGDTGVCDVGVFGDGVGSGGSVA
jgi:hypothetical protein